MDPIVLLFFSSMALILIFGAVAMFKGISSHINRFFGLFSIFLIIWLYCSYMANFHFLTNAKEIFFWSKMSYAASIFILALFVYFVNIFPESKKRNLNKLAMYLLPAPFLWALLYYDKLLESVLFLPQGVIQQIFSPMAAIFIIYFLFYSILALIVLGKKIKQFSGIDRMQSRYVYLGGAAYFGVVCVTNIILPLFNATFAWHAFHVLEPITCVFFAAMSSSAVARHKFMGINALLGKGLVYSIIAGTVTAVYYGFLYLAARLFQGISGNYSMLIGLFFFFIFSVLFQPFRDRLQEWVDRTFFKSKFDYEKTLKETSSAMSVLTDRDRILKLTARLIIRRMKPAGVAIFICDDEHNRYVVKGSEGACKSLAGYSMSGNYPLIEYLRNIKKYALKSEMENQMFDTFISEEKKKKDEEVLSDMAKLDVSLCVPSIMSGEMAAFIALGNKISGDMFNKDDLNFLSALANQTGIFLENTKLIEREKESAKIMAEAQAREKYTVMLEKINKELVETREQLVKAERLTTVTKMTVSLQHEINNPLTSVLVQSQALLMKMQQGANMSQEYVKERLTTVEREARRIRELLRNLANITEPVSREYVPGEEMIDIKASSHDIDTEDTGIAP